MRSDVSSEWLFQPLPETSLLTVDRGSVQFPPAVLPQIAGPFIFFFFPKCDKAGFLIDVLHVTSHFLGQRELWAAIREKGDGGQEGGHRRRRTTRAAIRATVISSMYYSARPYDL